MGNKRMKEGTTETCAIYVVQFTVYTNRDGNTINIRERTDRSTPIGKYRADAQSEENPEEQNARNKLTETLQAGKTTRVATNGKRRVGITESSLR